MRKEADIEILASRVLLRPADFEASYRFYAGTLGLATFREFGQGAGRGVVFFLGGGFLELSGRAGPAAGDDKTSLWLQVRDLDATWAALEATVPVVEAPLDKPWGLREARIRDPDRVLVVLVEIPEDHPLRRDPRS